MMSRLEEDVTSIVFNPQSEIRNPKLFGKENP